jgi:excisionase family DNA binding protein
MNVDRRAYSIAETAQLAGLGITKVKEAIRLGELEARKVGRRVIITDTALSAWIANLPKVRSNTNHIKESQ